MVFKLCRLKRYFLQVRLLFSEVLDGALRLQILFCCSYINCIIILKISSNQAKSLQLINSATKKYSETMMFYIYKIENYWDPSPENSHLNHLRTYYNYLQRGLHLR